MDIVGFLVPIIKKQWFAKISGAIAAALFLLAGTGVVPAAPLDGSSPTTGVGELGRLISLHPPLIAPKDYKSLDVFERPLFTGDGDWPVIFSIYGFNTYGCGECHLADDLLDRAAGRMRGVLKDLRSRLPWLEEIPLRQYIVQPWADELLSPNQFAHTTFDTVRIFPGAVLIDSRVYGLATHLHESLHLTQSFLGHANELEAYGLNIRSDPRFLILNFPYFSDVVTTYFVPDFPRILEAFFARPVRENIFVPREVQWFLMDFDSQALDELKEAVKKMEPLLVEVSRLNRTYPLEAAYLSEQTGNPALLLEIAAVKLLPLPALTVTEEVRQKAFAALDVQIRKTDNTRLGYRIDRKKEAFLTIQHQMKVRDPIQRRALYFHYLKQRFIGPEGQVQMVIEDREDFLATVERKLGQIEKMIRFEGLTPLEREAGKALVERIKKDYLP